MGSIKGIVFVIIFCSLRGVLHDILNLSASKKTFDTVHPSKKMVVRRCFCQAEYSSWTTKWTSCKSVESEEEKKSKTSMLEFPKFKLKKKD